MKERIAMDFSQKTAIIVGTGISGIAACELLLPRCKGVYLYDGNSKLDADKIREKSEKIKDVEIILGDLPQKVLTSINLAILSPGVPLDSPIVLLLKDNGVEIIGEIELAYILGKGSVVAITGTNGKTTTTSLVGHIMGLYHERVKVVGNIGIPYTQVVEELTTDTVVVAEISSFQLETIKEFAPKVSAILNITPDHLNRHYTMENYIAAKESITKNQKSGDVCVLNYEDEVLRKFGESLHTKVTYFSSLTKLSEGLYTQDGIIYWAHGSWSEIEEIIDTSEMNILGAHNHENAMAAIAMCSAMGVPMDVIRDGLRSFVAVEHRIEYVCERKGVAFYNDSKGTNPDAAIKAVLAMNRPTVLIGGGYDKDSTYDEWVKSFGTKVKKLVLIGQTRYKIADCCKANGFRDYCFADTLEEAMQIAYATAVKGDAILLSPACASWGMFENYEVRGRMFKDIARGFAE